MNIALLGGSNSRKLFSLESGLKISDQVSVVNYSLGGTGSLQNLYACIKNIDSINRMDLIVTESNVNDSHIVATNNSTIAATLENIDKYYEFLATIGKKILCLILPINFNRNPPDSFDNFLLINECHMRNVCKYNFDFIDLHDFIYETFSTNNFDRYKNPMNLLMSDLRHVKTLLMYEIGKNVSLYYLANKEDGSIIIKYNTTEDKFIRLSACELGINLVNKRNSLFNEDLLCVDKIIRIPKQYIGYKILGISTWGEGRLKIYNNKLEIIKEFNNLYSFNEIISDFIIDKDSYIDFTSEYPTEPSLLTNGSNQTYTYLEGMMLEKDSIILSPSSGNKSNNLSFLIPNLELYMNDTNDFLNKSSEIKPKKKDEKFNKNDLLLLMDAAVLVEKTNLNLSLEIIQVCFKQAPNLNKIKKKLDDYRQKLNDDEKVKDE